MQAKPLGDAHFRVKADGFVADFHASGNMVGAWSAADVVGRHVSQLVPPNTSSAILDAIKECLATNSVIDINYMFTIADHERAREAHFTPIGNDEVLAVVRDVTERRAEDAKRVHLAEILEASTDYVATTDLDGRILYANGAFRRRFGVETIDDIITNSYNLFGFLTPEGREKFLSVGVPELWSCGHWSGEIEALDPDGTTIPMWQAAIAHLDSNGKPEYFSGISRDISEMKIAQTELRNSEERFRALVAESSDVILVLTQVGRITYASPALERLLGYPDQSLLR